MTFSRSVWLKHKENPEFRAALAKGESLDRFETPEPGEAGTGGWSGKTFTEEEQRANYQRIIEHQERESAARKMPAETPAAPSPATSGDELDLSRLLDPSYYRQHRKEVRAHYRDRTAESTRAAIKASNESYVAHENFSQQQKAERDRAWQERVEGKPKPGSAA